MTNLEIISELKSSTFINEDGEGYQLEFLDRLTDAEIEVLKTKFPAGFIHPEIVQILKETKGWNYWGTENVFFDSIGDFGFWELSPISLTLGHDGFGNCWVLDIDKTGQPGKVFFACHDPAVFVVHSQTINEFLGHMLEFYKTPENAHMTKIYYEITINILKQTPNVFDIVEYRKNHLQFEGFLNSFEGDDWVVADIRSATNGDGFYWGKYGSNQYTKRHPDELVWVIKKSKDGFFKRFFGI